MIRHIVMLFLVLAAGLSVCQADTTFSKTFSAPALVEQGTASAWGDMDNDDDLDIAYSSYDNSKRQYTTTILRNDGGAFTPVANSIVGVYCGRIAWGDYDNDGNLDLIVVGDAKDYLVAKIYQNKGSGVFQQNPSQLMGVRDPGIAWGDYDNDGDLDLAIAGNKGNYRDVSKIYRNDGGNFADIGAELLGLGMPSSTAWGDYDKDGDLDLVITGSTGLWHGTRLSKLYRNDDGKFVEQDGALASGYGTAAWGDYNNDGWIDLLIIGSNSKLYRNDHGRLVASNVAMPVSNSSYTSATWGDYDNDGDIDIALGAPSYPTPEPVKVLRNDGYEVFTPVDFGLPRLQENNVVWGDYNRDGRLDLLISGNEPATGQKCVWVFRNDGTTPNTPPAEPSGHCSVVQNQDVTLSWNPSSDTETPANGLLYNVRVGTAAGKSDIFACTAGVRGISAYENAQGTLSWLIKGLLPGTYYWSVQAIDTAPAKSAWASEKTFTVGSVKISGYIKDTLNRGYAGVVITADNGGSAIASKTDGYYELSVPYGWSGRLTASKLGFWFSPASIVLNDVTLPLTQQNFLADTSFVLYRELTPGLYKGSIIWGDYDGDGALDLLNCGGYEYPGYVRLITQLQHNSAGVFTEQVGHGITDMWESDAAWGDYDNDGDLDVAICGFKGGNDTWMVTRIYQNVGAGKFVDIQAGLVGTNTGTLAWGDYNNDGRLDLIVIGHKTTWLYRNDGNNRFTMVSTNLPGASIGDVKWGDYNHDGLLDLAISCASVGTTDVTAVFRNTGTGFEMLNHNLANTAFSSLDWGDYDNDGDPDLAVCGWEEGTLVYRNDNGTFANIGVRLGGGRAGDVAWADMDNDGDLDLAACGEGYCKIYRNDAGTFVDINADLPSLWESTLSWGDFDNDGDLDLAISGQTPDGKIARIYRNDIAAVNTPPSPPAGLTSCFIGSTICFNWNAAEDAQTPSQGLTYNLRVGTAPGKSDIFSGMALVSGARLIPATGNVQNNLSWNINSLSSRVYYWSVQAIDSAMAPSPWSREQIVPLFTTGISPADARKKELGEHITFAEAVVSVVYNNSFYVQRKDRTSGIQVRFSGKAPMSGRIYGIVGTVQKDPATGECFVAANSMKYKDTGSVEPLRMANVAIGGTTLGLQDAVWGWKNIKLPTGGFELQWLPAVGLNNIGLLIRTSGRVTHVDPEGKYFYIDDGSNLSDGTAVGTEMIKGVRIDRDGRSYTEGQFIIVTGISSCYKGNDGKLRRLVRPTSIQ